MSNFPKTIAAIEKRDRCMWEIGDALLAECGPPSKNGVGNNSYAKLEAAAREIEHLKIDGYTVDYLAKLRQVANDFPSRIRNPAISWAAHRSAGSPEMLTAIVDAVGKKPITNTVVRTTRKAIEDKQDRDYRKQHPDKSPPKRRHVDPPKLTQKEIKGLALAAEVAEWVNNLKRCGVVMDSTADEIEQKLSRLDAIDTEYLTEIGLSLAEKGRRIAEIARKLRSNRRAHLAVVS